MSDRPDERTATGQLPAGTGIAGGAGTTPTAEMGWGVPVTTAAPDPQAPPTYWAQEQPAVGPGPGPGAGADPRDDSVDEADLDLLDATWTSPHRVGRVTLLLAGGLVAALGFAGGALVQRSHDGGLASTGGAGAGAAGRAFARSGGFGGFGTPTGGGSGTGGSGTGTGGQGTDSGGRAGSAGGAGTGAPVVVGKVLSVGAGSVVVENFAGTKVTVRVPATAAVTTTGLTGLRPGATVSVTGTKAADGSVTATSVTSRGSAG